jgi:Acetyltransferases, including N-acetylases of ribosomal proteins
MIIFEETKRLILREVLPEDEVGFYELDSDPDVHKYIGSQTIDNIEEARETIRFIRKQYIDNGIGRWAVIEKSTNNFIGWSGLKLIKTQTNNHINYYDLGYRLIKRYWGNGYATEAAFASLNYGFDKLALEEIYADANIENAGSNNVLKKVGFRLIETFEKEGIMNNWYQIKRDDWIKMSNR